MAKDFLSAVNDTLKRVAVIQGADGELSSFTDSGRQTDIDLVLQLWNEAIHDLYSHSQSPLPKEAKETTITLKTDQREYVLPPDLEQINWPLINEANGYFIVEYHGGYEQMRKAQLQPSQWTGRPQRAAVNPTNGQLRMEYIPTSEENGLEYKLFFDKRLSLENTTDLFPFSDTVVDAMIPVVAELWRYQRNQSFNEAFWSASRGRASRLLTKSQQRRKW